MAAHTKPTFYYTIFVMMKHAELKGTKNALKKFAFPRKVNRYRDE